MFSTQKINGNCSILIIDDSRISPISRVPSCSILIFFFYFYWKNYAFFVFLLFLHIFVNRVTSLPSVFFLYDVPNSWKGVDSIAKEKKHKKTGHSKQQSRHNLLIFFLYQKKPTNKQMRLVPIFCNHFKRLFLIENPSRLRIISQFS